MKEYLAEVTRDGKFWMIDITGPDVELPATTQAKSFEDVEMMARDYLYLALGLDTGYYLLTIQWNVSKVWRWNVDKPHRCPHCHAVVEHQHDGRSYDIYLSGIWLQVSWGHSAKSFVVYQCCRCKARYTRWPFLAPLLRVQQCNADECARRDHS